MRDNAKRRADRARRKQLFEQLRLQAELLCDSNNEGKTSTILSRMMLIILDVVGKRSMNSAKREALAAHFTDCAISREGSVVELGGPKDRDVISISGHYNIDDLAKRIAWSETRTGETIEMEELRNASQ